MRARDVWKLAVLVLSVLAPALAVAQESSRGGVPLVARPDRVQGLPVGDGRRVALVIGQDRYAGGLNPLANPTRDARAVAALFGENGFEVVRCGEAAGCFDLNHDAFAEVLTRFEARAAGASLAFVFFAGHGLDAGQGNVLTPIDARVDCASGTVAGGMPVERVLAATRGARAAMIVLDSCRDNPVGQICPALRERGLSFTRIEAGDRPNLLLVTSTQFGAQALDGRPGAHSPFATAFLQALKAHPRIYFEQVINEVGRATTSAAEATSGVRQIPGKVVGTPAPTDCLAGSGCSGDTRMAALAAENEALAGDAAGLRNILADEERVRGKPYTPEERRAAVERISRSLTSIAGSAEPKVREASRLIRDGQVSEGRAKLDEALDDDEKAAAEIERLAKERRRTLARNARDAAALARGTDLAKALTYFERATRNDPEHAETWGDYGVAAVDAGRLDVAKRAFEHAALKARESGDTRQRYWATLGLGDVAAAQGSLPNARRHYEAAKAIVEPVAAADPGNAGWQRDLSVSQNKIGYVLVAQGDFGGALAVFRASHAIFERLAAADPGNAGWQRDLSVSQEKIGNVLVAQGDLGAALATFKARHAIAERLAAADPGNAGWQRDLSVSHTKIGDVLVAQGDLKGALAAFKAELAIAERLAESDPGNAGWQRDLSVSHNKIGDMLRVQGDLGGALSAFRAGLVIIERLAASDPGNAGWQRDVAASNERIGDMHNLANESAEAIAAFERALTTYRGLLARNPDDLPSRVNSVVPLVRLGGLKGRDGRADLQAALDILKPLAAAGRLDAMRTGWIATIEAQLAALK